MWEIAATLVVPFLAAAFIYWLGGRVAPRPRGNGEKLEAYGCGERINPAKLQLNVEEFFIYALYFMIFDILAFLLATSMGTATWLPLLYIILMLAALVPIAIRKV